MDFDKRTAPEVIKVLEAAKARHVRVRIFLGNTETGEVWMEENDVLGYIGNSMGPVKAPILLYNASSRGGCAILTHRILAIRDKDRWLYKHPLWKEPKLRQCRATGDHPMPKGYIMGVDHLEDGSWVRVANFKSVSQADRYVEFMHGWRMAK